MFSIRPRLAVSVASIVVVLTACTINAPINADFRGRGNVPANDEEIKTCQDACGTQKSASCLDEAAFAGCTAACTGATSDQVATYDDCVKASPCNMTCNAGLRPAADAGPSQPDAGPAVDASRVDAAKPDAGDPNANYAACTKGCDGAIECFTSPETQKSECYSYCSEATPAARLAFASCSLPSNGCSNFYAGCWSPLINGH
jgi:hypothetical protein